jgi:hypothetical protein
METEGLFPCPQEPVTGPCPELKESGPYLPIIFLLYYPLIHS